jgi:hypothetical protein
MDICLRQFMQFFLSSFYLYFYFGKLHDIS